MLVRERILVLLVVVVGLVAGGRTTVRYIERQRARLDYEAAPARELPGSLLNESPEIGRASVLSLFADRLLIGARRSDSALYVVSAETGELIGSAGAKGDRRGRFRAPGALVYAADDPAGTWLYDVALRRLTRVHLSGGKPVVDTLEADVVQLRSDLAVTDPAWLTDGRFVAPGLFTEGRLGVFEPTGALSHAVGSFPPNLGGDSSEAFRIAHLGKLRTVPDRTRVVVSALYAGRLDIYETRDWSQRPVAVPFAFAPEYAVVEGSRGPTFAPTRNTRYGYIDLAVTEDRILGLFSGRTEISHPGRDNYAEYVHAFDWDGRFLEAYRLDEEVFLIAVDGAEGRLYAARHLPEPAILVYELDSTP